MVLAKSLRRKLLATVLSAAALVLLYQATVMDSRRMPGPGGRAESAPLSAGSRSGFVATAYCKGQTTRSGVLVQAGIAAADPTLLPEGSVIQVEGVPKRHAGIYTVMDTGPLVKGRHVDLYMWSCFEALDFGRRDITVTVLRYGWSPKDSAR